MARITVEDCLDNVENRFQLVLLASKRARVLARHPDEAKVAWNNDKPTVAALREIAEGHITQAYMKEKVKTDRYPIERPMPAPRDDLSDLDDEI
ncbi:DNA-directed RNA polymerase subunit omega [Methylococcus sp. ANG]|jgi:DNA-directed RNA polymerase subunit omega|uniref:DNA-directed RNA polymerase subunit omega n=1 Tax=unclassified Methylococcus TaxID=2618889 RepID=UPI001C532766|nr:DNA-directed RNA polymerase subunit omega [Methylococcus sp. Mc7]QXP84294.1 DNA-directed RNA polymerase subunit omega [Methylococcus sp. Mc7]